MDDPDGNIVAVVAENKLSTNLLLERMSKCTPIPPDVMVYPSSYSGQMNLRKAFASMLEATFMQEIPVSAENIIVQAGAGALLDNLFWVLGEPGQGILVPAPYYPQFDKDLTVKCEMVPLPFVLDESGGADGVTQQLSAAAADAEARGVTVLALLLTNPNNPLGIMYSRTTLLAALEWCMERGVHVVRWDGCLPTFLCTSCGPPARRHKQEQVIAKASGYQPCWCTAKPRLLCVCTIDCLMFVHGWMDGLLVE